MTSRKGPRRKGSSSSNKTDNISLSSRSDSSSHKSEVAASLSKILLDNSEEDDDFLSGARFPKKAPQRKTTSKSKFPKVKTAIEGDEASVKSALPRQSSRSPKSRRNKSAPSVAGETPKRRVSRNPRTAPGIALPVHDEHDGTYGECTLNDEEKEPSASPLALSAQNIKGSAKKLFDKAVRAASPTSLRRPRSKSAGRQSNNANRDSEIACPKRQPSPGRLKKHTGELDTSRGDRSTSSKSRSQSPGRLKKRAESPGSLRRRAASPGRFRKWTEGPGALKKPTESSESQKKRAESPGKLKKQAESTGNTKNRTVSPGRLKKRAQSPGRLRKRSQSPGRLRKRAESPGRLNRNARRMARKEQSENSSNCESGDGKLGAMLDRDAKEKSRKRETRSIASGSSRRSSSAGPLRKPRSSRSSRSGKSKTTEEPGDKIPSKPRQSHRAPSISEEDDAPPKAQPSYSNMKDELQKHKVKRNRSMDPTMALALQKQMILKSEEEKEQSERTRAPVRRAASMILTREMGRRGNQESSIDLIQYKEEEIHSTSYFASNHVLINRERMKRGLRPLTRNVAMDQLARKNAEAMAKSKKCKCLETTYVGNVIRGESIRSIHQSVMLQKQGRERANILNPYFQDFGVGTSKSEDGELYMCQLFSERLELPLTDTLEDKTEQTAP
ncbi:unnamed protein product [Pseudo-nitzschia multistriata]|uniref:SCP domain-containing protein n=1 Tax=Pseudo-nitzschia multistriata TaxID=183589 RepID=A0A448YYJ1_9STRA|nr:unnamed protein product [Pseudo-nitzschia multistriata]